MTPRIEIFDDADEVATAVGGALLQRLATAQRVTDARPDVGLTGGSIAERVHRFLGRSGPVSDVDWGRVGIWWGDERYVATDSPDRNAAGARRDFLDHVPLDAAHVHEAPASDSGLSLAEAAATYAGEVREHGKGSFEVLMLGIGPDGHVASLFPGRAELDVDDEVVVPVADSPKPPPERISLTLAALNRSRSVWFIASGEEKAEAVARALAATGDVHETPARGITVGEERDVVWFLDRPAASHL